MKKFVSIKMLLSVIAISFLACGSPDENIGSVATVKKITIDTTLPTDSENIDPLSGIKKNTAISIAKQIPTLIIVMNWSNYSELGNDTLWHDQIFGETSASVNGWYKNNTAIDVTLIPVAESYGTQNDGVVMVDMGKNHPGVIQDENFRNNEINAAIQSAAVKNHVDFASFDTDNNGYISYEELQIIFIAAGGEQAYGDSTSKAVWAHSWNFEGITAPVIDGVTLMYNGATPNTLGFYALFGARHSIDKSDEHKASIGIMAHEIGHSLYNLIDLYDTNYSSSGVGVYDIMSSGTWGQKDSYSYAGSSPTQFSSFSKRELSTNESSSDVYAEDVSLKCSANEMLKLETDNPKEYFLLECRDTAREDSDRTFNYVDGRFTTNRLFTTLYHVDEDKINNTESGTQTASRHYKVAVVERDNSKLMTTASGIYADYSDVYTVGGVIDSVKTSSYSGENGYRVEILSADYTNRSMRYRITK